MAAITRVEYLENGGVRVIYASGTSRAYKTTPASVKIWMEAHTAEEEAFKGEEPMDAPMAEEEAGKSIMPAEDATRANGEGTMEASTGTGREYVPNWITPATPAEDATRTPEEPVKASTPPEEPGRQQDGRRRIREDAGAILYIVGCFFLFRFWDVCDLAKTVRRYSPLFLSMAGRAVSAGGRVAWWLGGQIIGYGAVLLLATVKTGVELADGLKAGWAWREELLATA